MVVSHESSDSAGTSGGMHMNLVFAKVPDSPTLSSSVLIKGCVPGTCSGDAMPIITIGFDNEVGVGKHKVDRPLAEHLFMHLELQTSLLEFGNEDALDAGHLGRKALAEAGLTLFLSRFRRMSVSKKMLIAKASLTDFLTMFSRLGVSQVCLAYFLDGLWRVLMSEHRLALSLPHFWSALRLPHLFSRLRAALMAEGVFLAQHSLACFLSLFRRSFVNSSCHFMFNYNRILARYQ